MVVDPNGEVMSQTGENEDIVYADVSMSPSIMRRRNCRTRKDEGSQGEYSNYNSKKVTNLSHFSPLI